MSLPHIAEPILDAEERFEGFENLMPFRVQNILLVSSLYDSFILREDGRLNELLIDESLELNLRQIPGITHVSSCAEALDLAKANPQFNLIVTNLTVGDTNAAALARAVRRAGLDVPVVVLGYDYREIKKFVAQNPVTDIDGRNKFYKYGGGSAYHKYDKEFHPIYLERVGLSNSKMIVKYVPFEALWHVKVEANELMSRHVLKECSEKAGKHIETVTIIMDCTGLGMQHFLLPALKILGDLSEIDVKHYPERLHRIYYVNSPRIFTMFYDFGKSFFDERVLSKVRIVSPENTKAALLEIIDEEHLPSFLGGKCTCSHLEGGCVPSQQLAQKDQVYENILNVSAWSDYSKEIEIKSPSLIKYKFKTIEYDISFGVKARTGSEEEWLVENKLVNSHEDFVEGIIHAKQPGTYIFFWDNTYSMMRSKDLHFTVEIEETREQ